MSAVAAVIGLALAAIALDPMQASLERDGGSALPYWARLRPSPELAAYAAGLALTAAMIVGVVPALKATGRRVQAGLKELSTRGSRVQLGHTWTVLIVAQVAMAVAVLPFAVYTAQVGPDDR